MTTVPVLDHITALLAEQDRRYEAGFIDLRLALQVSQETAATAMQKADEALEARLHALNDFKVLMETERKQMMPRSEAQAEFSVLREKIDELKARLDSLQGKASGYSAAWLAAAGAVGVSGTVFGIIAAVTGG